MKFPINCLLAALLAVSQLTSGYARSLPPNSTDRDSAASERDEPAHSPTVLGALVNSTKLESSKGAPVPAATTTAAAKHLIRKKRVAIEVDAPYDLHTTHMFCDLDVRGRHRIVTYFPNHCIWVWNNKYVHEGFYHLFKHYQTEAFFFGQYNERLKQYETVAHVWAPPIRRRTPFGSKKN